MEASMCSTCCSCSPTGADNSPATRTAFLTRQPVWALAGARYVMNCVRIGGRAGKFATGEIELFTTCLGGPACRFHDSSAVHSAVVRGVSISAFSVA